MSSTFSQRKRSLVRTVTGSPVHAGTHPLPVSDLGGAGRPSGRGVRPPSIPGQPGQSRSSRRRALQTPGFPLDLERAGIRCPPNSPALAAPEVCRRRLSPGAERPRLGNARLSCSAEPCLAATQQKLGDAQGNSARIPPPALRSPTSPASDAHSEGALLPGGAFPSPKPADALTWGLAALPAASGAGDPGVCIRKGARFAAGRPRALRDPGRAARRSLGTSGARSAPSAAGRTRAPAPITALSAGRGARGAGSLPRPRAPPARRRRLVPGAGRLSRAAQTPGPERAGARVRREGERASALEKEGGRRAGA